MVYRMMKFKLCLDMFFFDFVALGKVIQKNY